MKFFLIPLSLEFSIPKILGFLFLRKIEKRREFTITSKIADEWDGHLEIFRLPQGIENSRQFLPLRTDILQKTVVGCP